MRSIAFIINSITKYVNYFDEEIFIEALPNTQLQFYYTTHANHEVELAKRIAESNSSDTIIVAGGDGTTHKVLQSIANRNITLGIIPTTIGCSFARYLGIEKRNAFFAQMIQNNKTMKMDLLEIDIPNVGIIYGMSYTSIGYIADVVKNLNRNDQEIVQLFWLKLVNQVRIYNNNKIKADIEFNYTKETIHPFEFLIANIDQYSGNVKVLPSANISDGILEIMLIRNVSTTRYLSYAFLKSLGIKDAIHDVAEFHKTEKINLFFDKPTPMQIDTELYDNILGNVGIRVLKQTQKLIVPSDFH